MLLNIKKTFRTFINRVVELRHNLLVYAPDRPSDYVSTAMQPVYKGCRKVKAQPKGRKKTAKRGMHLMRVACLVNGVVGTNGKRSLFDKMLKLAQLDWQRWVEKLGSGLKMQMTRAERKAMGSVKTRFVEKGSDGKATSKAKGENVQVINMA